MADLNLLAPSTINGKTKYVVPSSQVTEILSNPTGSGKIFKINALSIKFNSARSGVILIESDQVGSGFLYDKYDYHAPPDNTSGRWKVINKNEMFYLQEGDLLKFQSTDGGGIYTDTYITISYEEIS